jgi:sugar phosphate isomerase/epimerase
MQGIGSGTTIKHVQNFADGATNSLVLDDPLDTGTKPSIFDSNGLTKYLGTIDNSGDRSHVILVVGCSTRDPRPDFWAAELAEKDAPILVPTQYTFQDPAHLPFMRATAHQLLLSGCYAQSPSFETKSLESLLLGWFLPVTPRCVKMPLLPETIGVRAGIKALSAALREQNITLGSISLHSLELVNRPPRFRLIPVRQNALMAQLLQMNGENGGEESQTRLEFLCEQLIPHDLEMWCWLELGATTIILWDAGVEVSKKEFDELEGDYLSAIDRKDKLTSEKSGERARSLINRLLLAVAVWKDGKRTVRSYLRSPPSRTQGPKVIRLRGHLKPAFVTSFDTAKDIDLSAIGTGSECIEWYFLMQSAAERILLTRSQKFGLALQKLRHRIRPQREDLLIPRMRISALELMARSHNDEKLMKRTALSLMKYQREIVALATYLPSLCRGTRSADQWRLNPALLATKFVIGVAKAIKEFGKISKPIVVEVVGGGLVLPPTFDEITGEYNAACIAPHIARGNLINCSRALLDDAAAADALLAFEYEPSLLCALGSLGRVTDFCEDLKSLARADERWNRVGMNLDIAHWAFLGGHKPFRIPKVVRERFFHAHVSAHSNGHLADSPLESGAGVDALRRPEEFMAWFMLLEHLMSHARFQGKVSLELECCKSRNCVNVSLGHLSNWLQVSGME